MVGTVLTWRLLNTFTATKLLDGMTYRSIMKNLTRAKKAKVGDGDWQLVKVNPSIARMLSALGLDPSADEVGQEKT